LNRREGVESERGLEIEVRGIAYHGASVTVNGVPARVSGDSFTSKALLRARTTLLTAEAEWRGQKTSHSVTVFYDKNSFRRYRMSLDDNIECLEDVALNARKYKSIFENPYLGFWREMNRRFGMKLHINIYYEKPNGFNLTHMPATFKNEWRENAHWLKMRFHARANDPNRPYLSAPYEKVAREFEMVENEQIRFAGEESRGDFTTIHWGEATREGCRAARDRGIRGLCGYFIQQGGRAVVSYYLDEGKAAYMSQHDVRKDLEMDLFLIRHAIVINTIKLADIPVHMQKVMEMPHASEVLELMIHEQYFYPWYVAHIPEFRERVSATLEWVTAHGYKPVHYEEGFLGNPCLFS
jgi:hypothetical protein